MTWKLALLALWGLSCSGEPEEMELGAPTPEGSCTLYVPDGEIDFGAVEVSEVPAERSLLFRNDGDADCLITELVLSGASERFALGALDGGPLPPQASRRATLNFQPVQDGLEQATLRVRSNDSETPGLERSVLGWGTAPELEILLEEESQDVSLGCTQSRLVVLRNTGSLPLRVDALALEGDEAFQWSEAALAEVQKLPWTLDAGEGLSLAVLVDPGSEERVAKGWIEVSSNAPEERVTQDIAATLSAHSLHEQSWSLPLQPKSDVVFIFDWSSSLSAIFGVVNNFGTFVEALEQEEVDYQITAIVPDSGCHIGGEGPVTAALTEAERLERFTEQACAETTSCTHLGSDTERALTLLVAALSAENTGPGGCNAGIARPDAELHVIALSDEPEQSAFDYSTVLGRIETLPENPDEVTFHGIGGDWPSGCGAAAVFANYYPLVAQTGGQFRSICDSDFYTHMLTLGRAAVPQPGPYVLEAVPVAGTLQVVVDGRDLDSGWTLDPVDNALLFDTMFAPARGSELVVRYASAPEVCP